ncbi:MAG: hypothetical protein ABIR06_02370 [Cyclobacteriaceae bacterium]
MRNRKYFTAIFLIVMTGCTRFENAELTERNNFVHFYSSGTSFTGSCAEVDTDGGFILTGEIRYNNGVTDALIIKTDPRGQKVWEKVIPNGLINAVRPTANGYILLGDGIKLNASSPQVSELVNSHAQLLIMDKQGTILAEHIKTDSIPPANNSTAFRKIDYHGNALTFDPAGNIIILGTFRVPGENESSFISAFDPSNLQDSLWYRSYVLLDNRDYVNCNAIHLTSSSDFLWASKTFTQQQNVSREYLSVLTAVGNSTIKNNGLYGERDEGNHSVADIQKSGSGVGYGVIGTYSNTNGANANIYFIRVDQHGSIIPESTRYIDGENLILNNALLETVERATSSSQDEGAAIIGTIDGYVLAATITSTPTVGNGGKDILLIKTDAFGNLLWSKLIGGTGDETVTSLRETPDKGLLISGTNTINGLSSIMLMKTDEMGDVKN